jgi:hypothetical protein
MGYAPLKSLKLQINLNLGQDYNGIHEIFLLPLCELSLFSYISIELMIMNENTIPLHAQSTFIEIHKLLNQPP